MGSGKSSVLAALLGELQPFQSARTAADDVSEVPDSASSYGHLSRDGEGVELGAPLLVGKVAYCSQVPWVVAGTIRVSN